MIAYRLTREAYSHPSIVFNGIGASNNGRRWNAIGTRAAYCSQDELVCAAEIGYYSIISQVDLILGTYSNGTAPTKARVDSAINQEFVLTKFEIDGEMKKLDISTDLSLSKVLKVYGIKENYTVNDSRKSPYSLLPSTWTQTLGTNFCENGYHALTAKSARSDRGNIEVLFSKNILPDKIRILSQEKLKLSAVDVKNKKINFKNAKPVRNKVMLERTSDSFLIDILEYNI
jgi:hypothetical protein